ncbi:MAG: DUF1036 domain-containing protein [Pseudomonadota bacterium]
MNLKVLILTTLSMMFSLQACAEERIWFWDKKFWQDKNEAKLWDRKFYNDSLIFKFCNESPKKVSIAIGYWKPCCDKGNFFVTEGWWNVEPGKCKVPFQSGGLAKLSFYLNIQVDGKSITDERFRTAEGDTGGTLGCVETNSFFLLTPQSKWGKACKKYSQEVPFVEIKEANKYNEYTFTHK